MALCLFASSAAGAAQLPDGRGYELVSPSEKYGGVGSGELALQLIAPYATADGEHVLYPATLPLPGSENGQRNDYLATRGPGGWASEALLPASSSDSFPDRGFTDAWTSISEDGRSVLYGTSDGYDPEDRDLEETSDRVLSKDFYLRRPDGSLVWVTRNPLDDGNPNNSFPYGVVSGDGSHVVFASSLPLVPADEARSGGYGLYDWHDGQLSLVARNDEGSLLGSGMGFLGLLGETPAHLGQNPVSRDGSRIFFFLDGHAYVRENAQNTRPLGNPNDPAGVDVFAGATPDGSKAWVLTNEQLTADDTDSGFDLYEWHAADGSVTRASGGDSGAVQEANVTPKGIRSSEDGSVVYFGAQGKALAPGAPDLEAFGPEENLYVRAGSVTKLVATLPAFQLTTPTNCHNENTEDVGDTDWRVTPDGRHLAIETFRQLLPQDTDTSPDVYEYSLDAETLTLVSQGPKGGNAPLNAELGVPWDNCLPTSNETETMSDDGRFAFFSTEESLSNEDINGQRDVYEHDLLTGETSLISSGKSPYGSNFIGVGGGGRDVFFATADALAPQDVDTAQDVYDARIGGGFPLPAAAPECSGETCRGEHATAPPSTDPASATIAGAGNVRHHRKRHRHRHAGSRCRRHLNRHRKCIRQAGELRTNAPAREALSQGGSN